MCLIAAILRLLSLTATGNQRWERETSTSLWRFPHTLSVCVTVSDYPKFDSAATHVFSSSLLSGTPSCKIHESLCISQCESLSTPDPRGMTPSYPWLLSLLSILTWYSHSEALSGTASGESTTRERRAATTASCRAPGRLPGGADGQQGDH